MSTRFPLHIVKLRDPKLIQQRIDIPIIRIICPVKFEFPEGTTDFFPAFVDSGAPISLVPQKIWKYCKIRILGKSVLRGLIPKEECELPAEIGKLSCFLLNQCKEVQKFEIVAYLPKTDRVPIILGFEGLLQKAQIFIDCKNDEAFLEVKE